jgi:hypothetical protein
MKSYHFSKHQRNSKVYRCESLFAADSDVEQDIEEIAELGQKLLLYNAMGIQQALICYPDQKEKYRGSQTGSNGYASTTFRKSTPADISALLPRRTRLH